ncbi:hypothetical protein DFS33DRAFT_1445405 [Desarmillaria ectypa]|nr:hypothetical protein DFS33DRAFT_1445405 [Desarmillaria ectypa]
MSSSAAVSDDAREKKSAEGATQSDNDQGPEVENSTYYSSRKRRKSTRGLMGVRTREYLVKGRSFSAVVTTFVAQTSQSLQVDYGQVISSLLFELIDVQRAAANGSLDAPRSGLTPFLDFRPTTSDSLVNGLWFTSLLFSLTTALFAVLTKQWIHQYMAVPSGTPKDKCYVRQFRYMGL